jgi:hypothetical protein
VRKVYTNNLEHHCFITDIVPHHELKNTGIANPSQVPGFTPGLLVGSMLLIFWCFRIVFFCFVLFVFVICLLLSAARISGVSILDFDLI